MKIGEYQERILHFIKGGHAAVDEDKYFSSLAVSVHLELIMEVVLWWRKLQLKGKCPISTKYLELLGILDFKISEFYEQNNISPYMEDLGWQFLIHLKNEFNETLVLLASFEEAMLQLNFGYDVDIELVWKRNPYDILSSLMNGSKWPVATEDHFLMKLNNDIQNGFDIFLNK